MNQTMKKRIAASVLSVAVVMAFGGTVARADELADGHSKDKVKLAIPLQARAFDLPDVQLLQGPFKRAQDLDAKVLLDMEPDRLLHTFRLNAGIPSTAKPLAGWEAPSGELRGHFTGHYLSACAMMYASTGDKRFKENAQKVVKGLAEVQAKLGTSGYLSAYPETFFDRVEARQRVWAPYYTLHKIFAGLLDVYDYCNDVQALEVCKKMGDWAIARNSKLTDAQMQNMLGEEHGGMNDALASLYAFTGDEKYLKISLRFNHLRFIDSLAKGVDNLDRNHANTQFPKFIGAARQYELTGREDLKSAASYFWGFVVHDRSYITGGNSDSEQFSPKARLSTALGQNTTETCNAYNMLKLTRHMIAMEPKVEYADFYERALFNQILGSQHPEDGRMTYYYGLRNGSQKDYRGLNSFVCCEGTGVENHAKYGDSIYFHDGAKTLYVNQFIASELNWREAGVKLRQETSYPDQSSTRLLVTAASTAEGTVQPKDPFGDSDRRWATSTSAGEWTLQLRHPAWAEKGFVVKVNGRPVPETKPGSYVVMTRAWKAGDVVEVQMPFALHSEGFADDPNRRGVMNGPIVLAGDVSGAQGPFPKVKGEVGAFVSGLKPVDGKPNTFKAGADVLAWPDGAAAAEMTFEPLYKIYNKRYEVYFDRAQ